MYFNELTGKLKITALNLSTKYFAISSLRLILIITIHKKTSLHKNSSSSNLIMIVSIYICLTLKILKKMRPQHWYTNYHQVPKILRILSFFQWNNSGILKCCKVIIADIPEVEEVTL